MSRPKGGDEMLRADEANEVLLRTFDLPDIRFDAVSGLDEGGDSFFAERRRVDGLDAIALDSWFKQSRLATDAEARRDCWLQVGDKVYVVWGAAIKTRADVGNGGDPLERWEFTFSEICLYDPVPD